MPTYTVKEMLTAANDILTPRLTDNRLNGIEQTNLATVMTNNTTVKLAVPDSGVFATNSQRSFYAGIVAASLSILTGIDGHHGDDFTPAEFYNATDFQETAGSSINEGIETRVIEQ
jgi:hypothetical protein